MLVKQLQRMRAECRMLRCGVELSTDTEIKNVTTIGDCRKLLRNLKVERVSLISEYSHPYILEEFSYAVILKYRQTFIGSNLAKFQINTNRIFSAVKKLHVSF